MKDGFNKIKVLLIDDKPEGLCLEEVREGPVIFDRTGKRADLEKYFDLKWIATIAEAREYRDLILDIKKNGQSLKERFWIPDLLIFDYAMTGQIETVEQRISSQVELERLSPIIELRNLADSLGIEVEKELRCPDVETAHDEDNLGCFVGGLIFTSFSDYTCTPLALTRKGELKTEGTEAGVFEWFLEKESYGTFKAKSRPSPTWNEILFAGVKALRERIRQLLKVDVIQIPLQELMALSEGTELKYLKIDTNYNQINLPLEGLFIDIENDERNLKIQSWAKEVLEGIISHTYMLSNALSSREHRSYKTALSDINQGIDFAESLWKAYCDIDNEEDLFEKRKRLSELLYKKRNNNLVEDEEPELPALIKLFGVDITRQNPVCTENIIDLGAEGYSDMAKRWAILFMIVRLLHLWHNSKMNWAQLCEDKGIKAFISPKFQHPVQIEDVYLALHPRASNPTILPYHNETDVNETWEYRLRSLNDHSLPEAEGNQGNLRIKINDILEGKEWEPHNKRNSPKGFLPGEKYVLRQYASGLDWPKSSWQYDKIINKVLF